MKFSTSKTELQQALQKLSKAAPTRSTLPILGCVLLEASTEKTTLRATDLEITIQVEISVSLERAGSSAAHKNSFGYHHRTAGNAADPDR